MSNIPSNSPYGANSYSNDQLLRGAGRADSGGGDLSGGLSGGGSGSASARAAAVAETTFQETLKAKMISGLYAAAKEIRS
jgi:hypothetical protein